MRQQTFAAVDLNTIANKRTVNNSRLGQTKDSLVCPNSYDYNTGHKASAPEYDDEN